MDTAKLKEQNNALLMAMLGSQEWVNKWWVSPNKAFDMAHPEDVDPKKVQEYLLTCAYGGW